jgi:hypothetical protein
MDQLSGDGSTSCRSGKRARSSAAVALVLILSVGLVGCFDGSSRVNRSVKNRAVWSRPLDEFFVYPVELDNYAEQLLIADCVTARGYRWPVPWQDTEFSHPEDFTALGSRLFTPELAEKWGYHLAQSDDTQRAELWLEFAETTDAYFPNAELDDALLSCTDQLRGRDKDFAINFDGQNYLAELSTQAQKVVQQDAEVVEATAAWRECLEPQVDFPLPQDPWTEMPPSAVAQKWGAVTGGTTVPSAAEIAAAVTDAECRESSGLASLAYQKNWEEQQKLVEKNRDKLDRIRADAIARKAKLLEIVAENAPPAP